MKQGYLDRVRILYENVVYWCICLFVIMSVWASSNLFVKQLFSEHSYAISAGITLLLIGGCIWAGKRWNQGKNNLCTQIAHFGERMTTFMRIGVIVIIPLIAKFAIIAIWDMPASGDIGVYIRNAVELSETGMVSMYADYSLRFPHLFWMGVLLSPLCRIGYSYKIFQITFALIGGLTAWLLYKAMLCWTSQKTAFVITLIYTYMPSSLFSCMTITHEMVFRLVLICVMWLISKMKSMGNQKNKIILWTIVSILIALSTRINQMTTILCISLSIAIVLSKQIGWKQKIVRLLMMFLSILIVGQIAPIIQKEHTESEHRVAEKAYAWAVYVGGNYQEEGRYNEADKKNISDYILVNTGERDYDTDAYENAAWSLAKERWTMLVQHPVRCMKHLFRKFMIVWSGSHYSIEYTEVYQSGIKKIILMAIMVLNNLIYLSMSIAAWIKFRYSGRKRLHESQLFCFSCTMVLGMACVLLIVEVMNKYNLTALIPLYIIWGHTLLGEA